MPILGVEAGWWLLGALGLVAVHEAKGAADSAGTAAQKSADLGKVVVIGGALYMLYRTAQKAGAA